MNRDSGRHAERGDAKQGSVRRMPERPEGHRPMSNIHPVSQELVDGPVVFVPLVRVKWLGDASGPRCDPFGAQPPSAFSCQHRIDYRGDIG